MKKFIIGTTLLVLVASGTFVSTVIGGPPSNTPIDSLEMILDDLNEILNKIGDFTSLASIADALEDISTDVGIIDSKLDTITRIYNEADFVSIDGATTDVEVFDSSTLGLPGGQKHFKVFIVISKINTSEVVKVSKLIGSSTTTYYLTGNDDFEFVGNRLQIKYTSQEDGQPLNFTWGVAVTYALNQ